MGLGVAAAAGIGGLFGLFGAKKQNKVNQQEAQKNRAFSAEEAYKARKFSERMRNTSWQAGIADMEAAGVNPALAYSQGGASAPTGAAASGTSTAPATDTVGSAMQGMAQAKTLKLMDQNIRAARADADTKESNARYTRATNSWWLDYSPSNRSEAPLRTLLNSQLNNSVYGATNMRALARRNSSLADIAGPMGDLSRDMGTLLPIFGGAMKAGGPAAGALARSFLRRRGR